MTKNNLKFPYALIGIDEAGRGPLAGPLVVGGVLILVKHPRDEKKIFTSIKDSKKLSASQRAKWFSYISKHSQIIYTKEIIPVEVIAKINVYQASLLGAEKVYQKLAKNISKEKVITKLDGGLKLKKAVHQTIIKGDEKIPVIAAASIVAKVTRDRIMLKLHKKYPQYGFDKHKGYGTKIHRISLMKYGQCTIHRRSFTLKTV